MDVRREAMIISRPDAHARRARSLEQRIPRTPQGLPSMESDAMTAPEAAGDVRAIAQPVSAPLTRAAIFMIVTVKPGLDHRATVRSFCGDLPGLFRAVEFRDIEGSLSCVMGIGSEVWDRLFGSPR